MTTGRINQVARDEGARQTASSGHGPTHPHARHSTQRTRPPEPREGPGDAPSELAGGASTRVESHHENPPTGSCRKESLRCRRSRAPIRKPAARAIRIEQPPRGGSQCSAPEAHPHAGLAPHGSYGRRRGATGTDRASERTTPTSRRECGPGAHNHATARASNVATQGINAKVRWLPSGKPSRPPAETRRRSPPSDTHDEAGARAHAFILRRTKGASARTTLNRAARGAGATGRLSSHEHYCQKWHGCRRGLNTPE